MVDSVNFFFNFINYPRHYSTVSHFLVEFETLTFEGLNLGGVEVNFLFDECVVVGAIDLDYELVFGWGFVVNPYLLQRCEANQGD